MGTLRNEKPSEMLIKTIRYSVRLVVFALCFLDRHSSVELYDYIHGVILVSAFNLCVFLPYSLANGYFFFLWLGYRVLQKAKLSTCDTQIVSRISCFLGTIYVLSLPQVGGTPISVVILDLTCSNRSVSYTFGNLACVQLGWYVEINFRSIWLWYPKILKCTTCTLFHTYTCVVRSLSGYIWWWNSPRCHYCWRYGYTLDDGPNGQIQWG